MRRGTHFECGTGARPSIALAAASLLFAGTGGAAEARLDPAETASVQCLLVAIAQVESRNGQAAVGDGGKAIGPYQIHQAYWRDSGVRGSWTLCRNARYARRVVLAYWSKYCPDALRSGNVEVLARVHNGGPAGDTRTHTRAYWRRIQSRLNARGASPTAPV